MEDANRQAEQARRNSLQQKQPEKTVARGKGRFGSGNSPGTASGQLEKTFGKAPVNAANTVVKSSSLESGTSLASGGRGNILARSSMEDNVQNHYKIMFFLQSFSIFYAVPTLVFVLVRNLVHCDHDYVDGAVQLHRSASTWFCFLQKERIFAQSRLQSGLRLGAPLLDLLLY